MSLILDALKKAEQDRHAGQAPALDEMLIRPSRVSARRPEHQQQDLLLMAAIVAALLFAVVGITYWLWPSSATTAPAAIAAATSAPAPVPATTMSEPEQPAPALRIDPERLAAPFSEEGLDLADTGASEASTMDDLEGDSSAKQPRRQSTDELAMQPALATEQPAPASEPIKPSARPLKQMPASYRNEFPRLVVDVHVYDDNPLRRFVLINSKKYRENDTLIDGPRVTEIAPDGIVVEYRGSQVLLELPR